MMVAMLTTASRRLIQAIHDHPMRTLLVATGAGAQALADLLAVGGASRTLIEGLIPYSPAACDDFLGRTPEHYTAAATARLLAGCAYARARRLEGAAPLLAGLACTAAIASDRPKRGDHRAHVAIWRAQRLVEWELRLEKGARDRAGEEALASALILNALADACGLDERLPLDLGPVDALTSTEYDFAALVAQLQRGAAPYIGVHDDGRMRTTDAPPQVLLSGAFNPLHAGHLGMAQAATQLLGKPVAFELAAVNVDKPPLAAETVLERMAQFAGRYAVIVSNAPTYVEKARLYPGATFVVGYDTAVRIFEPRYYGGSADQMNRALDELAALGCRFLVAGRVDAQGVFRGLADLEMAPAHRALFQEIPEALFRMDISSTELRARMANPIA